MIQELAGNSILTSKLVKILEKEELKQLK